MTYQQLKMATHPCAAEPLGFSEVPQDLFTDTISTRTVYSRVLFHFLPSFTCHQGRRQGYAALAQL
jgi:hypothetical protein